MSRPKCKHLSKNSRLNTQNEPYREFLLQNKRETCNSTMANDSAIDHGSERKQDFLTQKVHLLFKDYFKEKKLVNN